VLFLFRSQPSLREMVHRRNQLVGSLPVTGRVGHDGFRLEDIGEVIRRVEGRKLALLSGPVLARTTAMHWVLDFMGLAF
jgi:hypothetical protein